MRAVLNKNFNKRLLTIFGLLIIVWLFLQVDLNEVLRLWVESEKTWLLLGICFMLLQLVILTLKWSVLIEKKIPFWTLFKVRMIGAFFGTITPANAGTLLRAHYLRKKIDISLAASGTSVMLDKILEITSLSLLGMISVIALSSQLLSQQHNFFLLIASLSLFMLLMFSGVWLLTDKKHGFILLKKIADTFLPQKIHNLTKPHFKKLHPHFTKTELLLAPFLFNILSYANSYIYIQAFIWAIGADLSYYQIFITLPLSSIIALLPITISGIGTREASTIFLWSLFGLTAEQTLSVMLLSFMVGRLIPTFLGWYFLSTFEEKPTAASS